MNVSAQQVVNAKGGHNKFYRVFVCDDGTEVRNWGPIGTVGRFKTINHHREHNARMSADAKIMEELGKGYYGWEHRSFDVEFATPEHLRRGWSRSYPAPSKSRPEPTPEFEIYYDENEPVTETGYQRLLWDG